MQFHAWLTVAITLAALGVLVFSRLATDVVLVGALTLLLAMGIVSPAEAFSGFANPGVLSVAVLYIVAAGLRDTGAIDLMVRSVFGRPKSVAGAQWRMMLPVTAMSAFLNNTPIVATFLPGVLDWAKRQRLSASKLMIPLSYAAIFGGMCTLIGTSTNLVVNGLLTSQTHLRSLGFFELAWVGLPCAAVGIVYVLVTSRWLLPARKPALLQLSNPREYTVEMLVTDDSPLAGLSIQAAGLRQLPGLFLIEIERANRVLAAVGPDEYLVSGDRLVFAGITDSIVDLQRMRGLVPATDQVFKLDGPRTARTLIEAVISAQSPVAGKTVREAGFRSLYSAVVIAVARNGERVRGKIGDIRLRPGDMLLLEAEPQFLDQQRHSRDFLLLHPVEGAAIPRHERSWVAWSILAGLVITSTFHWLPLLTAALIAAALMIATRCCSLTSARRSIEYEVLIAIAAAFGIGHALQTTGAAATFAHTVLGAAGGRPLLSLAVIYVITMVLTELITNNAAAVIMFPFAYATSTALGLNFMPFAIAIMIAASASFATPIGYQTNLMVYSPGGYRFTDYIRFGLPLSLLTGLMAILIIPHVWPLH